MPSPAHRMRLLDRISWSRLSWRAQTRIAAVWRMCAVFKMHVPHRRIRIFLAKSSLALVITKTMSIVSIAHRPAPYLSLAAQPPSPFLSSRHACGLPALYLPHSSGPLSPHTAALWLLIALFSSYPLPPALYQARTHTPPLPSAHGFQVTSSDGILRTLLTTTIMLRWTWLTHV